VLDIAQKVAWDMTAPTTGPTAGMVIMGNPANTGNSQVRLIGNAQGGVYFPNQQLMTESGPNIATPRWSRSPHSRAHTPRALLSRSAG
jgi:hypothetical protein